MAVALITGPLVAIIGLGGTWVVAHFRRKTEGDKTTVAVLREELRKRDEKIQTLGGMLFSCLSETGEISDSALEILRQQFDVNVEDTPDG